VLSLVLGLVSLLTLFSFLWMGMDSPLIHSLGVGGAERLVAYPILGYLVGLGGYLTAGCR